MKKQTTVFSGKLAMLAVFGAVSAMAMAPAGCAIEGEGQKLPFAPKLDDGGQSVYDASSPIYEDAGDAGYPDSGYDYPDAGSAYPDSGSSPDAAILDAGLGDGSVCTGDGGCEECVFPDPPGEGPTSTSMTMSRIQTGAQDYTGSSRMTSADWYGNDDSFIVAADTWCSEWNISRSETISGSVGLEFELLSVGFSTQITTSWTGTKKEGYKLCSQDGPPCEDDNGTRRVARDSTLECFRECSKQITASAGGDLSLFGSGGSVATQEQLTQSNNVTSTISVAAGTPVSNLSGMCTTQLDSLPGSSFESLCDATDQDFEANLEWRYTGTHCGSAADPDGWCENQSTLPSVDAWTDSRCKVGGGPDADSYYTFCKLYSVPQGACPGTCSSGSFEYPCAPGLVCVVAPSSDVDCGCGLFESACEYHCLDDGSGTYDGPGAGEG